MNNISLPVTVPVTVPVPVTVTVTVTIPVVSAFCGVLRVRRAVELCLLLLCTLCLSGCGTYYRVSVDSLAASGESQGETYCLQPGNADISEDDLLFRDIARMLTPAFAARGFGVVVPDDTGGSTSNEPCHVARIEYWEEEPLTTLHEEIVRRTEPVRVRDGKKKDRIEYVTIEEPVLTTRTTYGASLLLTAFSRTAQGSKKQLWRTAVTCTGPTDSFRTLLHVMTTVLRSTLGTRTDGTLQFEVMVDDNGEMSSSRLD